jgi:HlyD family secretion protein
MKMPFTFTKKKLYIAVGILAVAGFAYAASRPKPVEYETETIARGDVVHEITVTGSIAPFQRIDLQPEVAAKVLKVYVTEGSEVKAGDALIDLDSSDVAARYESQRAAVDAARARLAELVAGATPQQLALAEASVAAARSKRDAAISAKADTQTALMNTEAKADAQMDAKLDAFLLDYDDALTAAKDAIDRLTSPMFTTNDFLTISTVNSTAETAAVSTRGTARLKVASLQASVAALKASATPEAALAAYASASADLAAVKAHLEACRTVLGYTSGLAAATLTTYQANVSVGLSAIDASVSALATSRSGVELQDRLNDADLSTAKAALSSAAFTVDAAEKALAQAEADLALTKSGSRAEVIAAQRAAVASAEATLSGLGADLGKRRITAPVDGTVTDLAVHPGETAQPSVPAVVVNAHGRFEIIANVSEVDIARVRVGQQTVITLDAFPQEEKWTGTVSFIEPAEKVIEGVIFYETRFLFDVEDERLRSGMTANLAIEAARADGVIRVPIRALREREAKTFVDVLVGGALQEREVMIGTEDDEYVECVSGLAEGDLVVTGSSEEK